LRRERESAPTLERNAVIDKARAPATLTAMSPSVPTIRDFRPSDAAAFRRLNEEWIQAHFRLEDADRLVLGDPEGAIVAVGGHILVATCDTTDEIVGVCALLPHGDGCFELAKMAVSAAHRRNGIGLALAVDAVRRARALGATRLYLESNSTLAAAIGLYRKLGFSHVPRPSDTPYARADVFMGLDL
jgi:ribosomal protein S18 acetylase RimI-like enzyme